MSRSEIVIGEGAEAEMAMSDEDAPRVVVLVVDDRRCCCSGEVEVEDEEDAGGTMDGFGGSGILYGSHWPAAYARMKAFQSRASWSCCCAPEEDAGVEVEAEAEMEEVAEVEAVAVALVAASLVVGQSVGSVRDAEAGFELDDGE